MYVNQMKCVIASFSHNSKVFSISTISGFSHRYYYYNKMLDSLTMRTTHLLIYSSFVFIQSSIAFSFYPSPPFDPRLQMLFLERNESSGKLCGKIYGKSSRTANRCTISINSKNGGISNIHGTQKYKNRYQGSDSVKMQCI